MLLQKHFFREALKEAGIPVEDLQIIHTPGVCINAGKEYPLIFPASMVTTVGELVKHKQIDYFYRGHATPIREWVFDFSDRGDISSSERGRDEDLLYELDMDYYRGLADAKFALCPAGDCPWTYRFFEAIMARAIPILNDEQEDCYAGPFKYYRRSEEHIYREDWVEHNLAQLLKYHVLG